MSPSFPGLSFFFQSGALRSVINAISSITEVQIVSPPSLMVLNNESAVLQIGDQIPVVTQQIQETENPNRPVINTIPFRDTGIILNITPRVGANGDVSLSIKQEASSVHQTTTSGQPFRSGV